MLSHPLKKHFYSKDWLIIISNNNVIIMVIYLPLNEYFWENSINVSLLTDCLCTPNAYNLEGSGEILYIIHAYFPRTQFGVNWHILHECWRLSLAYYHQNARTLKVFLTHQTMDRDTLWHYHTNVSPFSDGKLFACITPYGNTIQYYWIKIS